MTARLKKDAMTNVSHGPLGMVAGLGGLPVAIAQDAVKSGRGVFIVRFEGFEDPRLDAYPGVVLRMGAVASLLDGFKAAGCQELTMVGKIDRPDFRKLRLDFKGVKLIAKVLAASRKGDDALLTSLIKILEDEGFCVIGAQDAMQSLLAQPGVIAGADITDHQADIEKAMTIAKAIGALDIGQGAIVCDGLVLAVEAQEGTDAMLSRVSQLRHDIRGTSDARRGVLVKWPKPMQDKRADLPTIGPDTVRGAAAAGLAGIGVRAGETFVIDRQNVCDLANELGVFVVGLEDA